MTIDNELDQLDDVEDQDQTPEEEPERTVRSNRVEVEMSDGRRLRARVTNQDRLQWDKVAPRRRWGKATDVPTLAQTFVVWCALRREGAYDGKWEAFEREALDIYDEPYEPEVDGARPTTKAAGGTSS